MGTARLSRGFSYPLKRSTLYTFLDDGQIQGVTGVAYCGPSDDRCVLSADYRWPRNRGMAHWLVLWVNAVPSTIRSYIAKKLEEQLLPQLGSWIRQFTDQSRLYSQLDHRFEIYYDEVSDDGTCHLEIRVDAPRKQR
jgi:hypothetical protein